MEKEINKEEIYEKIDSLFKLSMNMVTGTHEYTKAMKLIRDELLKLNSVENNKWMETVVAIKLDNDLPICESIKNVEYVMKLALQQNMNIFTNPSVKYLLNGAKIVYVPRYLIEYDRRYIQLCVIVLARASNTDTLLSTRKGGSMKGLTSLISGHIDYTDDIVADSANAWQYIHRTAKKEFKEETSCNLIDTKIYKVIYIPTTSISRCHMGFLVKGEIESLDALNNNEPDTQDIFTLSRCELYSDGGTSVKAKYDLDTWTDSILYY